MEHECKLQFQKHKLKLFSIANLKKQTPRKHYKVSRAIPKNYLDILIPVLKVEETEY